MKDEMQTRGVVTSCSEIFRIFILTLTPLKGRIIPSNYQAQGTLWNWVCLHTSTPVLGERMDIF